MRFKIPGIQQATFTLACIYVLHLGFTSRLDLYIHPRYEVFTIALVMIGLITAGAHYHFSKEVASSSGLSLSSMPIMFVLGIAAVLPATTLSSSTVTQRSSDAGSVTRASNTSSLFRGGSSKSLTLEDWTRVLSANTNPGYYVNKPARIVGFVYDAGLGSNVLQASRFVVTCCAVDAQPTGVPVLIEGWKDDIEEDQWIEAEGSFELKSTAKGDQLVLVPNTFKKIDEPDNPYVN